MRILVSIDRKSEVQNFICGISQDYLILQREFGEEFGLSKNFVATIDFELNGNIIPTMRTIVVSVDLPAKLRRFYASEERGNDK